MSLAGRSDDGGSGRATALAVVVALLLAAALLRLQGLDWDEGQHLHPDERFLTMVETAISLPDSFSEYLDTARSPLNPANRGYKFFVYGTLPLFLVRAVGQWLGLADYAHVHLVGRALSASFDLGTFGLTYWLGAALGGRRVGVIACALQAFSVTSIQNAHFFTVDSAGAFFATAALCALVCFADRGSAAAQILFGALLALALGCRINLALLGAVHPIALLYAWKRRGAPLGRLALGTLAAALGAAVTFRLVQPYAFAGPGFFDLSIARDFLASLREVRGLVTGEVDYPPAMQWIGRAPILFPARNLLLWGIGPAWGLAALLGAAGALAGRGVPRLEKAGVARIAVLWGLALFGYHAWQFTPTGRYFLPVVPVLALCAAWALGARRRTVAAWTVVALTAAWAVAFTAIYRRPMSRVEASRWIYANVPARSTLAIEHWDDGLPLPVRGARRVPYRTIELRLYDEDSEAKRSTLVDWLAQADYVVLSSNRLYGSIPRAPWRHPLTRRYYALLFSGALGFRLERSFTSYPRIGSWEIPDDDAEEAFTVYDHPHVLVFRKTEAFSRENVERLLGAVSLAGIVRVPPARASRLYRQMRPPPIPLPDAGPARVAVGAEAQTSLGALVRWTVALELLSLVIFALLFGAMADTADRGFALARLLAWLAPGYLAWLACSFGIAVNSAATVRGIAIGIVAAGALAGWRRRESLLAFGRLQAREVVTVELVFWLVFGAFALARAFNPAIFWGEKPMDFAFLNALLRSRTMPPADPWFAGGTLNYFYFGHALVAFFARLAGVEAAFAFNLAIATVGGLLAAASYSFGRRLGGGRAAGVLAAAAVTLLGNLAGLRLLAAAPHRGFNFDYFWATSRVVPGTINEFPVWNLLFADLHAHVLAQPLEVGLLYLGLLWASSGPERGAPRLLVATLVALLLGAVSTASTWSVPTVVSLQLAFAVTAWRQAPGNRRLGSLLAVLGWWLLAVAASRALFWPFWASYRRPVGSGLGWETSRAPILDVLTIFGGFLVVLVPLLAARLAAWRRPGLRALLLGGALAVGAAASTRSASAGLFAALALAGVAVWCFDEAFELRVAGLLVALAGAIGLGTEVVFVWDRMNTVFKYYLEIWLLLGCAAGAILPRALGLAGRARVVWIVAVAAAAAAGGFTAVSGAIGLVRTPFASSDVPTLDGMEYLRHRRPAELAAFRWLARAVAGVPVVLEAQGDSYGEFGRVSMNTGLPTVLGWEYHLFQQAHPWPEIRQRRDDVRTLFSTTDPALAERLLKKYQVDLVFVGALERRTYPAAGLAKFASWGLTAPVFEDGEVTIYATPGLLESAKSWIDRVPRERAAAAPLGSFLEPRDLAAAPDGTLYVADFGNGRIQRIDRDGRAVAAFGSPGAALGQFREPCGVAVDRDGSVYVADTWNHRIQKLSAAGVPLAVWAAGFYGPRGIALDRRGRVWVADTGNHRVVRLDADGGVEREWGREGERLRYPVGIAVGAGGEVFVADTGHRRVAVFSEDGELLRQWPIDGWRA
ncbi:MAG: hypothetical protein HYY35_04065, partial [Deltaproteobacteria bacterium]|nr:hypothetical protein [Deltaproteobacteria bacterium]